VEITEIGNIKKKCNYQNEQYYEKWELKFQGFFHVN